MIKHGKLLVKYSKLYFRYGKLFYCPMFVNDNSYMTLIFWMDFLRSFIL